MVEFNLKRWLRTGEELITRDGVKVLYAKYFPNNTREGCEIQGILDSGSSTSFYKDGRYWGSGRDDDDDLFFVNDIEPEPKPKRGDTVWVRDCNEEDWNARIFLTEITGVEYPNITVISEYEKAFKSNGYFGYDTWKQMRTTNPALDKPKIEITVTVNGKEVKLSTLSDESLLAIKNAGK